MIEFKWKSFPGKKRPAVCQLWLEGECFFEGTFQQCESVMSIRNLGL